MPKLLIVDDSRVSRMMIRGKLQELQPDWEILEAASGEEALALAASHRPDFVTMDVNMPGMDGYATVARLREAGIQAKVVMLTANIQESSREKARQLSVQFVQKPVSEQTVRQAIDYFLVAP